MKYAKCATQEDLERAILAGARPILIGEGPYILRGAESVVVRGSSQPRVEAWENSQPRVVARGSSQPRVVAWGSSQPRVVAWGSSQPRVEAWGYVQLVVEGAVVVEAAATVAVLVQGDRPNVTGGQITRVEPVETPEQWCVLYGARVVDGVATLFKAVRDDYRSAHGFLYAPGTSPEAPDWDGGHAECSGGLHFCAHPCFAKVFDALATRYVACPVAISDIVVHREAQFPTKIKARRVYAPIYEVDEDGEPIEPIDSQGARFRVPQ